MARKLKRKPPKTKRKDAAKPAKTNDGPAIGAPVQVTNAQVRVAMFQANGDEAKAARALGISRTMLRLLLPEEAKPQPKPAEPDVSVAEFDRACRAKRAEREARLAAREAEGRRLVYGTEVIQAMWRDHEESNPDVIVEKAISVLMGRTPTDWHVRIPRAAMLLSVAMGLRMKQQKPARLRTGNTIDREPVKVALPSDQIPHHND